METCTLFSCPVDMLWVNRLGPYAADDLKKVNANQMSIGLIYR